MRMITVGLLLLLAGCATDVRVEEADVQRPAWMSELPAWAAGEQTAQDGDWIIDLEMRVLVGADTIESLATLLEVSTDRERIVSVAQRDAAEALTTLDANAESLAAPRLRLYEERPAWLALTASSERGMRMTARVDQVSGSAARVRYEIFFVKGDDPQTAGTWTLEGTRRLRVGQTLLRMLRVPQTGRNVLAALTLRDIERAPSIPQPTPETQPTPDTESPLDDQAPNELQPPSPN